ncbi:hypothetical protein EJB05_50618, partial [Eragrostis curvula]
MTGRPAGFFEVSEEVAVLAPVLLLTCLSSPSPEQHARTGGFINEGECCLDVHARKTLLDMAMDAITVESKRMSPITEDGSMDRRGSPAVRATTGSWRSAILLLGKRSNMYGLPGILLR